MAWILTITTIEGERDDDIDLVTDQLWSLGTTGVAIDGSRLVAGFGSESEANAARQRLGGTVSAVDPLGWPTPEPSTLDVGGQPLTIDSGHSFGHGHHPTTRLCLRALEDHLHPGRSVLDVGCGSGVLSLAAKRLGAGGVIAIDIDPDAVAATRSNATRNGIDVEVSSTDIAELAGPFDVVVANMLITELEPIADEVVRVAGDLIIVSGVLADQRARVLRRLGPSATLIHESVEGAWLGATFRIGS